MPNATPAPRAGLPALTSLRFVAAAMIVVGHAGEQFGTLGLGGIPLNQGVSFFFVLSGFILLYNYPEFQRPAQVTRFIVARLARIWPAHVACLALFFTALPRELWYIPYPTPTLTTLLTFNLLLVQSWIPFKQIVLSLNGVAWSISVELFFYLAFPALVYYRRLWRWQLAICVALVAGTVALTVENAIPLEAGVQGLSALTLIYNNPLTRLLEFLTGMLAARVFIASRTAACTVLVATALELLAWFATVYALLEIPPAAAWLGQHRAWGAVWGVWVLNQGAFPLFALLIGIMARGEGLISAAMSARVALFLGEISFALYLVHQIVLRRWSVEAAAIAELPWLVRYALLWTLLLALSALIHLLIERPARQFIVGLTRNRPRRPDVKDPALP